MKISKDMIIADVIREVPGAIDILFAAGLSLIHISTLKYRNMNMIPSFQHQTCCLP